ncbi:MAG: transaldolase family protein [Saprospiraceae bacterium]
MKFFIDTASIDQIKEANELGILDGVTTNPSLMAKEGITGKDNILGHYAMIAGIVEGDVSAEVISTDFAGMVKEARELADIAPNIVVKIPMIKDGVKALSWCAEQGISTNCTLVFSGAQAILAAKAGATYVSPFIGRIDDISWDGMSLISQIAEIYAIQGFETEILAARSATLSIQDAAVAGADVVTAPLSSLRYAKAPSYRHRFRAVFGRLPQGQRLIISWQLYDTPLAVRFTFSN